MKKLLIAMTAAAVGACAWAEGVTLLGQNFDSTPTGWTVGEDGKVSAVAAPWSYSGENGAVGDGELTLAEGALSLNTGSKKLTGNFASNGDPTNIVDSLYFKSTVTFKDPSDTLPTLGAQDKFALVVLDNVESFEADPKLADTQTTNLWVIAKYGTDENVKRAYKLNINGADDSVIQNLDAGWLSDEHTIVVKAYDNVMAATPNRAGFLVMVDGYVCTVDYSCAIVDGVIDFKNGVKYSENNGVPEYLGFAATDILGSVRKRYTDNQLLLSMTDNNATLASVDFQGQGVIDDVELTADGTGLDFGSDSLVFTVEGTANGVTITSDTTVYYSAAGEKKNITFTLATGWVLKGVAAGLEPGANGVYTYQYTTVAENDQVVTIEAYKPAAYVGTTPYETFSAALAAANGSTVKLSDDLALTTDPVTVDAETTVTLDLAGKTISTASAEMPAIFNNGALTIIDTVGGGKVNGMVGGEGQFVLKGGSYLATANTTEGKFTLEGSVDTDYEAKLDATETYWTVAEKVIVKYTVSASYDNAQVSVSDLTTGEVEENTVLSFSVAPLTGFENVVVMAGDTVLPLENGKYTWTVVANVTITITADAVVVGPSIDDKNGTITVDNSGNATINTTNATVTVTGTVTGDVIVTPSVGTVNVTLAQGKTVKIYSDETNITGAFTVTTDGTTTTIALNPEGEVEINGAKIKVMPEMAQAGNDEDAMKAPLEVGTDVAVGVKTIPGLMYQLIRSDAPNGTFEGVGDAVKGTGVPVKLEDKNKPNGKGFYKIKVSQR